MCAFMYIHICVHMCMYTHICVYMYPKPSKCVNQVLYDLNGCRNATTIVFGFQLVNIQACRQNSIDEMQELN